MTETKESRQPLWRIVPVADYAMPAIPAQEITTKKMTALWRLIRGNKREAQSPAKAKEELRTLPEERLARLVPTIDWRQAAKELEVTFEDWLGEEDTSKPIRFLIGPPYGGQTEILQAWGEMSGRTMVEPPTPEQILAQDESWLAHWPTQGRVWVLPNLEHCYLRHASGLALVRQLLERAASGQLGRGLIGCDSWAWAYWQKVWSVPQPEVFALQAFDGERLTAYFCQLARAVGGKAFRVRNSKTGNDVLPPADLDEETRPEISSDLTQLAAHSRGNLGIAWKYWRARLRTEPDAVSTEGQDNEMNTATEKPDATQDTVWLAADLDEPVMPVKTGDDVAFVLHALLLHNGLSVDLLARLLPLSHSQVTATLLQLEALKIVKTQGNVWRVAALGYVTIRKFLRDRGYLTDHF